MVCAQCGFRSVTLTEARVLSLPLPPGAPATLPALLDRYTAPEPVHYRCDQCTARATRRAELVGAQPPPPQSGRASKQLSVVRPPRVLVVHLGRLVQHQGALVKLDQHVAFGRHLDLAPFLSAARGTWAPTPTLPSTPPPSLRYHLCALVVHLGNAHGGHYVAYRPSRLPEEGSGAEEEEGWLRLSDAHVEAVSWAQVALQPAFLLFYSRTPS